MRKTLPIAIVLLALVGCMLIVIGWQQAPTGWDAAFQVIAGTIVGLIISTILYWRSKKR